jgi:hypothetical protein
MGHRIKALWLGGAILLLTGATMAPGGEKQIVSLRGMSGQELRHAGFDLKHDAQVHIRALGGGGDFGWTYKSDALFAYGWIINAETREPVWEMTVENTAKAKDDRSFDGTVTLQAGAYEVYFAAATFAYHTTFTHISVNADHRRQPLWGEYQKGKKNLLSWFTGWWSDDIAKEWDKRAPKWGIDLLVDESVPVAFFDAPKEGRGFVLAAYGAGDNVYVRKGFALSDQTTLMVYALGEGRLEGELNDYGWIINAADRQRVWEMQVRRSRPAGGARKNIREDDRIILPRGEYILCYATDGSHSPTDWNDSPPYDPLRWGVSLGVADEKERKNVRPVAIAEDRNVIVSLVHPKDNDYLSSGFTLKEDARVRVYSIGERGNSRRMMADYGAILDAKTRAKVWTMDLERTSHAGGDAKNRYVDEVITLPRGSYIVTYQTDDSHSYDEWNTDPPFDAEHYGITVMGAGEKWSPSIAQAYVEERDRNIIAQIIHPGDDADLTKKFSLEKTTRVRVYSIGEGQGREMYDYGWIEDARTGTIVWEMTYGMTFHAGGGRKNRMVNTTITLERGEYRLRFKSDDSHSYGDWNVDPPEDPQYWGITLFRDDGAPPVPPPPPHTGTAGPQSPRGTEEPPPAPQPPDAGEETD